ncbi:MAG TPA: LLM class F420-dependent oxidoreductase [Solirubrobacteraceae bacterium]
MRLAMMLPASPAPFAEVAARVADLERAGLDVVLVPEAYSFDAVSRVGYLAARTERLEIGTGIVNVYSRSATLLGQTAAGCDYVSGGRFLLGLGVSGPQVIEGFHGIPYERPRSRTLDCIEVVRKVVAREVLVHGGPTVEVPLGDGRGTGLGKPLKLINRPVRPAVPIWWAAMLGKAVESAAEVADGWMPLMFVPEAADDVWGAALAAGRARRSRSLGPLEVVAGGRVAVGDDVPVDDVLDDARASAALYVGGMGARGKNFYNEIVSRAGFADAARTIQDHYLDGRKDQAAAAVPRELLDRLHLIGPAGHIRERVAAFRAAGVTTLMVEPVGEDPVRTIERLREIVDEFG